MCSPARAPRWQQCRQLNDTRVSATRITTNGKADGKSGSAVDSASVDAGIEPRSELSRALVFALVVLALVPGVGMAWPHLPTLLARFDPGRAARRSGPASPSRGAAPARSRWSPRTNARRSPSAGFVRRSRHRSPLPPAGESMRGPLRHVISAPKSVLLRPHQDSESTLQCRWASTRAPTAPSRCDSSTARRAVTRAAAGGFGAVQ